LNGYLFAAYAIAIVLLGGYVVYIARQLAGLRDELDELKRGRD